MPEPIRTRHTLIDGREISYHLRESARARWVSCWIRPETGLVVTVPAGDGVRQAEAFLLRHRRWVARETARVERRYAGLPKIWPYGSTVPFQGEPHEVDAQPGRAGRVVRSGHPPRVTVVSPSGDISGTRQVLQRWLKGEAEAVLPERVRVWGERMGLQAKRVYVRNLRAKWGSCWPGGSLSFNYRLVMAPPSVLDYVVIHELAHLRHRNHSTAFWSVVSEHAQDYRQAKAWLRQVGPTLAI